MKHGLKKAVELGVKIQTVRQRNPEETREAILAAGLDEFSALGLDGTRIERIAKRANINVRMIYHYFGSKNGLYFAVLEREFLNLRKREQELDIQDHDPREAIMELADFTFDYFNQQPHVVRLFALENLRNAANLQQSQSVPAASSSLIETIGKLLKRGEKMGQFRRGSDPVQLYVSIVALSCFHVSNGPTLSTIFGKSLAGANWIKERRNHMREMVLAYLAVPPKK